MEQRQLQSDNTPNNNSSNFSLVADHHRKSIEDKEMDEFLDKVLSKKSIGNYIRRTRTYNYETTHNLTILINLFDIICNPQYFVSISKFFFY